MRDKCLLYKLHPGPLGCFLCGVVSVMRTCINMQNPNRFFHVGEGFGFCSVIDDFYSESIALPSSMIRIRTRMP